MKWEGKWEVRLRQSPCALCGTLRGPGEFKPIKLPRRRLFGRFAVTEELEWVCKTGCVDPGPISDTMEQASRYRRRRTSL